MMIGAKQRCIMKTNLKKFSQVFAAMTAAWLGGSAALAVEAPTLTVTPSVVGQDYTGLITLNITGVTNTEKVAIQKYFDMNANGSIDAGDFLVDAFKIADGGAMVIGGIINNNVPFDRNPTNGVITTKLNFAPPVVLENVIGQQIYRLVSPTDNFTPVTATLLVTNAVTGQTLSGTVYSNGIAPLPHAVVVVLPPNGNGYTGAVVADSNGHYQIDVKPGTYQLMAAAPNYYIDQSLAPQVTVTGGVSATNDLFLTSGTVTISGNIYDAANSNGIGGLMFQLESDNLFAVGFTDTNGNYSAAVTPNFWKIQPNKERLPRRAYVVSQNKFQVDTTGGNVTNANVPLYKGNALFYGRITDSSNAPLANIEFNAGDTNNQYEAKGYSDSNGNYCVVALGDTNLLGTTNLYWSSPNTSANAALAGSILNIFDNTNVLANHAIQFNYVALPVTAQVSGRVRDSQGNPVAGVELFGYNFNYGGYSYQSLTSQTDNSGNYSFGVADGAWQVVFVVGGNHDLTQQGLVDLFQPYYVSIPPTNVTLNITVYTNGTPLISAPNRTSPTQFNFNVVGSLNVNYTVQVSTNLAGTNWANLVSFQLQTNNFPIVDNHATNSQRFYRILKN